MTGSAVETGAFQTKNWTWTVRSVNGKSFDLRCRLPSGYDDCDVFVREILKKSFARGSFQVSLEITETSAGAQIEINENLLDRLCDLSEKYCARYKCLTVSFDGLLCAPSVLEKTYVSADAAEREALKKSFENAVADLKKARTAEGAKMKSYLTDELCRIDSLADEARQITLTMSDVVSQRLKTQIRNVREAAGLSEERLAQEVALLLIRADVREEIDRLKAHVKTAADLLNETDSCGKKLDFLCQELNREANTLCSKSADIALTRIGLALKSVIDQFREQVQNIE